MRCQLKRNAPKTSAKAIAPKPAKAWRSSDDLPFLLQRAMGNHAFGQLLQQNDEAAGVRPLKGGPRRKFFTPEEVTEAREDEKEEEKPKKSGARAMAGAESGQKRRLESEEETRLPHAGDATIKCKSGAYVVDLGNWAGTPCGQPDCVTVHEESHKRDWEKRWPNGCKKADGTNQPDEYLPTGGEGYDEFLKKSECDAHIADLKCAKDKLDSATGNCKETWKSYIKLTEKEKKRYCTNGC